MKAICLYLFFSHASNDLINIHRDKSAILTSEMVEPNNYPMGEQQLVRDKNLLDNNVILQGKNILHSTDKRVVLNKDTNSDASESDTDLITDNHLIHENDSDLKRFHSFKEQNRDIQPILEHFRANSRFFNLDDDNCVKTIYDSVWKFGGLKLNEQKEVDKDEIYEIAKRLRRTLNKNNNFTEMIENIQKDSKLPADQNLFDDFYKTVLFKIELVEIKKQFLPFIEKLAKDTFKFINKTRLRDELLFGLNSDESENFGEDNVKFEEIEEGTPDHDIDFNEYYQTHHPMYNDTEFYPSKNRHSFNIMPVSNSQCSILGLGLLGLGAIGLVSSSFILRADLGVETSALSGINSMAGGLTPLNSRIQQFHEFGSTLDQIEDPEQLIRRSYRSIPRWKKRKPKSRTMTTRRPREKKENKPDKDIENVDIEGNKDSKKRENKSKDLKDKNGIDKKNFENVELTGFGIFTSMLKLIGFTVTGLVFTGLSYFCWQKKCFKKARNVDTEKGTELQSVESKK